jgi:outer membrane protein assembly factor BamB
LLNTRTGHELVVVAAVVAALGLLLASPSPAAAELSTMPDEGTVQTNGRVNTILVVGDRIYLGGQFTYVNGVPRSRLAAIDASTGELTDWAPRASTVVRALAASPDGRRIYVGGDFRSVSGVTGLSYLAAIDASTGAVDASWKPQANYAVRTLATLGDRVYIGGDFLTINGQSRQRLAAVNGVTGELDPDWHPVADARVRTLLPSPDGKTVYAGGHFLSINGRTRTRLAALNAAVGNLRSWSPAIDPHGPVIDLEVSGGRVYTAEGGPGGTVEAYNASTGARLWSQSADGDAQAVAILGDELYVGGHFDKVGGVPRRYFASFDAATGALDQQWAPSASDGQVWALEPDASRMCIYAGGEFTSISGQPHQGFAQFSQQGGTLP